MSLKLTVLGSCGGYPRAGRACSGYLLEHQDERLVLDMGMGVMSNLLLHTSFEDLTGVVLTHLHPDHYVDLYALYTARRFSRAAGTPLPVLVPPGSREPFELTLTGKTRDEFFDYLVFIDADEAAPHSMGGFSIEAKPANHSVPALTLRVTAGGTSVCYSGDTDECDQLRELATGCDLLLCEATFTSELTFKVPGILRPRRLAGSPAKLEYGAWF